MTKVGSRQRSVHFYSLPFQRISSASYHPDSHVTRYINLVIMSPKKEEEPYNIFRDSMLRYAGYANEVGESFRYQFPKFVVPSYAISFGYCFADAASTGYDTWKKQQRQQEQQMKGDAAAEKFAVQETAYATLDTLLWQSLASVMIPGAVINMVVRASRLAVQRSPMVLPAMVAKWLPTATGLGSVPLIIHPIDHSVDVLLDNTTRQWWESTSSPVFE